MSDYLLERDKIGRLYDAIYSDNNNSVDGQHIALDIHDANDEDSRIIIQYRELLTKFGILGEPLLLEESLLPDKNITGVLQLGDDESYRDLTHFKITKAYQRFEPNGKKPDFIDWIILQEETRQNKDEAEIRQRAAPSIKIAESTNKAAKNAAIAGAVTGAILTLIGGGVLNWIFSGEPEVQI